MLMAGSAGVNFLLPISGLFCNGELGQDGSTKCTATACLAFIIPNRS